MKTGRLLKDETDLTKYYFQVKPENQLGKNWDECPPFVCEFTDRENAIQAAKLLSVILKQQIRFTDNEYYKGNSGAYIFVEPNKNLSL